MTLRQLAFRNVIRNRRIYAAFFMASISSVMVFFIYSMLMYHPRVENEFVTEIAFRGMLVAEVILVLFMLFFLFYSMRAFLQARSKEFGILIHLGMEKKQLNKLVLFEILIIGMTSIVVGILFGFAFSKFFFMIVREILDIKSLMLYFSWKPFALTIGTFTTLFIVISYVSILTIKDDNVLHLIRGYQKTLQDVKFSWVRALAGFLLLGVGYYAAAHTTKDNLLTLAGLLPPVITLGTYLFFTDSIQVFLKIIKKNKRLYWHKYRLISVSEVGGMLKENSRMFFISSMVSTIAFLAIGTLSSLSTFSHQYHQLNPLSLVYTSTLKNPYERAHVQQIQSELQDAKLSYRLDRVVVKRQTSSNTEAPVRIISETDLNNLAMSLGYPLVSLKKGQSMFLAYSEDSLKSLKKENVTTVLKESNVKLHIESAYPKIIFAADKMGTNQIIVNDKDFESIYAPIKGLDGVSSSRHLYIFNVPKWQETKTIGHNLDAIMNSAYATGNEDNLPFYFENTGLDYSFIRSTFALLLFIGLLASSVFFLAAGSFIYFKLYTNLEEEKKQYETLQRMGLTSKEMRKLVNRQLIPQFFLPWGIAMLNSTFAFIALQVFWKGIADLSIMKEILFVMSLITCIQVFYFYLIRWRYLAHLKIGT
ncbi:FtsX-like permease family protein [Kurthia sibirica]|uniref:ABC transporter permease n=1 Tax=Kurthia sibirica TaxID=202750 RepID=A0A2U3AJH9_9BACL|nr:ABC transporter permease [Kurthia sibirica]PWI24634.1 ABC transporter permease [Kurthia sibirica]GEK33465.1 ABC transporter permease [Kurthia sibirica]